MTWLIFALGAAMVVAGALSIVSGYPYTRIEWGWTEVIAGATIFSGGALVIAVGAILLRLESLRRAVERGGFSLQALAPSPSAPLPQSAPPGDVVAPEPVSSHDREDDEDRNRRLVEPPYDQARAEMEAGGIEPEPEPFPEPNSGPAESLRYAVPSPLPEAAPSPRPRGSLFAGLRNRISRGKTETVPPLPQTTASGPMAGYAPSEPGPEPQHAMHLDGGSLSDLPPPGQPLRMLDEAYDDPGHSAPALSDPGVHESRLVGPDYEAAETGFAGSSGHGHGDPEPALALAREPAALGAAGSAGSTLVAANMEEATVVGRYQAGGASYVLFSDGTIEVESDAGLHRFASMQDLKAFIERSE